MKYLFSLAVLAALAFVIRKLGLKKVEQIGKSILESFKEEPAPKTAETKPVENKELAGDQASLAALEIIYKDVLAKISTLQQEQKWGVKDDNGFYYSIDKDGVLFSGANSTDEYNTMVQQLKDYTDKKAVLTKKIAGETTQTQSLELPLELQAILSAIKAKLHYSVDEDSNDNNEQDTNTDNDNSDYGSYGSYGNDGGGSGGGGYFPYQPAVVTPVTTTTPVNTPVSASSIFSNILNVPKHAEVLPVKSFGNLSNILNGLGTTPQVTPTPTPTPNTPVISTVQTNNASNARTSNARTNNNYSHRHASSGRRRY